MFDYDKMENYDEHYATDECKSENNAIKAILEKYITPEMAILDVGCGTGFLLDLMGNAIDKAKYLGVDVAPHQISRARMKYRDEAQFIIGDAGHLTSIGREKFDAVVSLFSIPYIGENAADVVFHCLKEDGIFIGVYYDKPYKNKASVYSDRVLEYKSNVKPAVERLIDRFSSRRFEMVHRAPLTETETYEVCVYRKVVK